MLLLQNIRWALEIILAPFSWGFLAFIKMLVTWVVRRRKRAIFATALNSWNCMNVNRLDQATVDYFQIFAPRMNPHAVFCVLEFSAHEAVVFDVVSMQRAAKMWTVVVNMEDTEGGYCVWSCSSTESELGQEKTFLVDPANAGKSFEVLVRYYNLMEGAESPAIRIDGNSVEPVSMSPNDSGDFCHGMVRYQRRLYSVLHQYVFPMLYFQRFLPENFVRQQFMPVPNPETHYRYGVVQKSNFIEIRISPQILTDYWVYYTLYNRASIPVQWFEVTSDTSETKPYSGHGFYLFRFHPKHQWALGRGVSQGSGWQSEFNNLDDANIVVIERTTTGAS